MDSRFWQIKEDNNGGLDREETDGHTRSSENEPFKWRGTSKTYSTLGEFIMTELRADCLSDSASEEDLIPEYVRKPLVPKSPCISLTPGPDTTPAIVGSHESEHGSTLSADKTCDTPRSCLTPSTSVSSSYLQPDDKDRVSLQETTSSACERPSPYPLDPSSYHSMWATQPAANRDYDPTSPASPFTQYLEHIKKGIEQEETFYLPPDLCRMPPDFLCDSERVPISPPTPPCRQ